MKLYHGTSENRVGQILAHGIKPRKSGRGNWGHTVESNPNCVYLTTGYAIYFASHATKKKEHRLAVIEIDTEKVDRWQLVPDEDFLEQATRKSGPAPLDRNMKYRTRWYRRRLLNFREHWTDSIEHMGTCGYYGVVDAKAITRVALLTHKMHMQLIMHGMDPTITTINYRILGAKYRNYCHWLFGDTLEPDPFEQLQFDGDTPPEHVAKYQEHLKRHNLANMHRDEVEVKTL